MTHLGWSIVVEHVSGRCSAYTVSPDRVRREVPLTCDTEAPVVAEAKRLIEKRVKWEQR